MSTTTIRPADAPASRETDVLVARVLGWEKVQLFNGSWIGRAPGRAGYESIPYCTLDDERGYAAMRESLAWLRKKGLIDMEHAGDAWRVYVWARAKELPDVTSSAQSLPLAVARVVLMVGESDKKS